MFIFITPATVANSTQRRGGYNKIGR